MPGRNVNNGGQKTAAAARNNGGIMRGATERLQQRKQMHCDETHFRLYKQRKSIFSVKLIRQFWLIKMISIEKELLLYLPSVRV